MGKSFDQTYIDDMRRRFEMTGNPLWVWQAILAARGGISGEAQPLPEWCLGYLDTCARSINRLWSEQLPAEALKQLPAELGFSSAGKNAFKTASTQLKSARLAVRSDVELRRGLGLNPRLAEAELLETEGLDEFQLRKSVSNGRKLVGLPTPKRSRKAKPPT